jgi:hypothetical protein
LPDSRTLPQGQFVELGIGAASTSSTGSDWNRGR